jgi:hypothetical protein
MGPLFVLLAALTAALMLVVVLGLPPTKKADAAPRTVTKVFSNQAYIDIPATGTSPVTALPYPSKIIAGGFNTGTILDVNVILRSFSHTWPPNVDVLLAHRGVNRTVMSDVGFDDPAIGITLVLDDEATSRLPLGSALLSGRFKPTNEVGNALSRLDDFPAPAPAPVSARAALNGFDGVNPNGAWSLYVVDDIGFTDGGEFAGGWSLRIKARVGR